MTKFKKILWNIVGFVPFFAYIITTNVLQPFNRINGVIRQNFGNTVWIVLFVLHVLLCIVLGIWYDYCTCRAKGTAAPGWRGYLDQFRIEKKYIFIILGIFALVLMVTIFYKPL